MKRVLALVVAVWLVMGCGPGPTTMPDLVGTQVAVMQAAAATLTAGAPATTATKPPTVTLAPPAPTSTAVPTETRPPAPTPTVRPTATALAIGPSLGPFAVVSVAREDVLNVRQGPGVGYGIAGTIPYYGLGVEVHAGGLEVDGSWWVPVVYGEVTGWANSRYLARQSGWTGEAIAARAAQIILALRDRDLEEVGRLAHPAKGVRFSPYTFVRAVAGAPEGEDLVFSAMQLAGLGPDATVYHWGRFEGSGEPIDLTFAEYYEAFVYDVDFARPDVVGFGQMVGQGNIVNNIATVYPEGLTVEYHFEGFEPPYAGMDWRSLRLVLEPDMGRWSLVGVVHDEWTP